MPALRRSSAAHSMVAVCPLTSTRGRDPESAMRHPRSALCRSGVSEPPAGGGRQAASAAEGRIIARVEPREAGMTERAPRLAGKVAIVTGAGSRGEGIGNGRATAILFAREGAQVLLVGRSREPLEATLRMIEAEGGEAAIGQADVTRAEDCAAMVQAAVERWGRLDILHN